MRKIVDAHHRAEHRHRPLALERSRGGSAGSADVVSFAHARRISDWGSRREPAQICGPGPAGTATRSSSSRPSAGCGRTAARVQRLARKINRSQIIWPVDIALLADQRVPPQPRLNPDLIALPGEKADLDERGAGASRSPRSRLVASLPRDLADRLLLNQRFGPRPACRARCPDAAAGARRQRPGRPVRLVPPELFLQQACAAGCLANRTRPEVSRSIRWTTKSRRRLLGCQVLHRDPRTDGAHRSGAGQRHGQQPRGLVHTTRASSS